MSLVGNIKGIAEGYKEENKAEESKEVESGPDNEQPKRDPGVAEVLKYFKTCATTAITEGQYFPLRIRRDKTVADICKVATRVLNSSPTSSKNWQLPCLFNGSGAGKTFISFNAASLVREYLEQHTEEFAELRTSLNAAKCFRIFLKQMTSLSYEAFCENLGDKVQPSIRLYFKWFIASQLLLPQDDVTLRQPNISQFGVEMKKLHEKEFLDKLDYSVVFAALRKQYNIATSTPIWIFVSHDEVQALTPYTTLLKLKNQPDEDARRGTVLYQYLRESMDFTLAAKQAGIQVLNIYSGTFRLDITNILQPVEYHWHPIPMEPLTVEDGVALLSSKHPPLSDKMKTPLFKQVLSHLGNIPQIWRIFSEVIAKKQDPDLDPNNLRDLNERLREEVKIVYHCRQEHFKLLLLLALQNWTLEEARQILPQNAMLRVHELLNAGLIFFVDQRCFVPPILLRSLALNFQTRIKQILIDFPDSMLAGHFTALDFAEFCIAFFTLKRNLLVSQGVYTVPVVDFFNGAWISSAAAHAMLTLATPDNTEDMQLYKTLDPTLESLEHVRLSSGEVMNALAPLKPTAFWTGNADPHQDGVLSLPDTLIQFEMKYTSVDTQQSLTGAAPATFQNETKKAENSSLRLGGINKNIFFVYATNGRMTADTKKRAEVQHVNSIIISSGTFSKVFSPTFEYVTSLVKSNLVSINNIESTANTSEAEEDAAQPGTTTMTTTMKHKPKAAAHPRIATSKATASNAKNSNKRPRGDGSDAEEEARAEKKPTRGKK